MFMGYTTGETSVFICMRFWGGSRNDEGAGSSLGTDSEFAGIFGGSECPAGGTANLPQNVSKSDVVIAGTGEAIPGNDDVLLGVSPDPDAAAAPDGFGNASVGDDELDASYVGSDRICDTE